MSGSQPAAAVSRLGAVVRLRDDLEIGLHDEHLGHEAPVGGGIVAVQDANRCARSTPGCAGRWARRDLLDPAGARALRPGPGDLDVVHRDVRLHHGLLLAGDPLVEEDHADAARSPRAGDPERSTRHAGDERVQLLGHLGRLVRCDVAEQDRELVAAEPRHRVGAANALLQRRGDELAAGRRRRLWPKASLTALKPSRSMSSSAAFSP